MPTRDGTGPMGQGPATGGARGGCLDAGYAMAGYGRGRGWGGRFGRGFGRGRGFYGPVMERGWTPEDERALLEARAEQMRQGLAETERRLKEMSREPGTAGG